MNSRTRETYATWSKHKRVVLTIAEKLEVCKAAKHGRSLSSLAMEYGIGKATVHDILKSEEKLKDFQTELHNGDCVKK